MIKAILFDADGTLFDLVNIHFRALNEALEEVAGKEFIIESYEEVEYNALPTSKKLLKLSQDKKLDPKLFDRIALIKQYKTKIYINDFLKKEDKQIEMLEWASQHYKLAICTNSIRETLYLMVDRTETKKYFDLLLSNQDVTFPKPHCQIWVLAMELLGVAPCETLIIEDSEPGLLSAYLSGANVLPINNPQDLCKDKLRKFIRIFDACK